jgi:hypothetical protein
VGKMIHGPTFSGNYNLLHVKQGAFVLEGNLPLEDLKKLHKELGTVIAKAEKSKS